MGWWSDTIMGGDEPCDWVGFLCDGWVEYDWDRDDTWHGYPVTKELIDANLGRIIENLKTCKVMGPGSPIGWQVLGVMIVEHGAQLPDEIQQSILQATKDMDPQEEGWCDPDERQRCLDNFYETIQNYRGEPVKVTDKGLFEALADLLDGRNKAS
jgi:hypothetical protein